MKKGGETEITVTAPLCVFQVSEWQPHLLSVVTVRGGEQYIIVVAGKCGLNTHVKTGCTHSAQNRE